jgi:hypothetical protein
LPPFIGQATDAFGQFQLFDFRVRMSLVPEGVGADIDLAGPFEPLTTFSNLELSKYFRVAEGLNTLPLAEVNPRFSLSACRIERPTNSQERPNLRPSAAKAKYQWDRRLCLSTDA